MISCSGRYPIFTLAPREALCRAFLRASRSASSFLFVPPKTFVILSGVFCPEGSMHFADFDRLHRSFLHRSFASLRMTRVRLELFPESYAPAFSPPADPKLKPSRMACRDHGLV